jgi:hypothetical protein
LFKQRIGKRKPDVAVVTFTPRSKQIQFTTNRITLQLSSVSTTASSTPQSASTQLSTPQSGPQKNAPTDTPQPGRLRTDISIDLFNHPQAILINQDIVPLHLVQPPSVLQPVYKHLLPHDLVRLTAGEELIILIPKIEVVKQMRVLESSISFIPRSFVRSYRSF